MKQLFIFLIFCFLCNLSGFSQSSPCVLKTDIWYGSEQLTNQMQSSSLIKSGLQRAARVQDSAALLNFHTVKTFDEKVSPFQSNFDISKSSRLTVIVVFHSPDTATEHGIWSVLRDGKQVTGLTDKRLLRQRSEYAYPVKKRGIPLINTSMQAFSKIRGKADSNHFVLGEAAFPDSTLSRFSGDIAECLVFNRFLQKAEALKIETYLAIKYGISLIASDYLSPAEVVLWHYEENKAYSNGIAGIGKDSAFGLNQKQGCSSEESDLLTISTGNFSTLNKNNHFILPEGNYLVWGHNGTDLIYNETDCEEAYPLPERKWLMQTTYSDVNNKFSTKVRLQMPEEYRDTGRLCYLVIDRSGTGDFSFEYTEYIVQSQMDEAGFVYFDTIIWDTDGSGKDVFSFSFGAVMELVSTHSCSNSPTGTVTVSVCGGSASLIYLLSNNNTSQQFSYQGGREYTFENLSAGTYTLTVTDNNNTVSEQVEIGEFPVIPSTLPIKYTINNSENSFDAEACFGGSANSYLWEKDSVFLSNKSTIDISASGCYKLTVTDTNGCTYIFNTLAEENVLSQKQKSASGKDVPEIAKQEDLSPQYKVFPNPTTGKYLIEADLPEESPVTVRVFTVTGSLIDLWEESGKKYYSFESYISTTGNYIIEIETAYGIKDFKLVVAK